MNKEEWTCKCGCGINNPHDSIVDLINRVEAKLGEQKLNSGCRCKQHNDTIGGVKGSAHEVSDGHPYCYAADLAARTGREKFVLIKALMEEGCKRIEPNIGKGWCHADTDPDKPQEVMF